jgi:hypothetical protein
MYLSLYGESSRPMTKREFLRIIECSAKSLFVFATCDAGVAEARQAIETAERKSWAMQAKNYIAG